MKNTLAKKVVRDAYENPRVMVNYYGRVGLWSAEERLVQRFFPQGGGVLDLGCGTGRTSIALAQKNFHVVGLDLSFAMVRAAREEALRRNLKTDFIEMDAMALAFTDQSFDGALFSANGIDHVPGYAGKLEVLRQVFRVLKPGAPFIFSTHRIWSPFHLRKLILGGLRLSLGRIMGFKTLEKEWGDLCDLEAKNPEERYGHFMSSRSWKQGLHAAGFDLVCQQSRVGLKGYRLRKRICRGLSSQNYAYFVARRPGQ